MSCETNAFSSSDSSQMRQQHINTICNNNTNTNTNNTKLPQFSSCNNNNQQFQTNNNNNNNIKDNKRKSALPKGVSTQKVQSNTQSPQASQTNMGLVSNISLLNNITSSASTTTTTTTTTHIKPISKLQPPTLVSSANLSTPVTALTINIKN